MSASSTYSLRFAPKLRSLLRAPELYESPLPLFTSTSNLINVHNPSTNELVGSVPDASGRAEAATAAIESSRAAARAFKDAKGWAQQTPAARGAVLQKLAALQRANIDDLSLILASESGKPIKEAKGEIEYAASYFQWFGEEARRHYGSIVPSPVKNRQNIITHEPVGPCFLLTPFNFPCAMLSRKAAAALAAGNTVLARPSEDVPLSAVALASLAIQAGVPANVFNVVTSSRDHAALFADAICANEEIAKVSFTGSTAVGRHLVEKCAPTLKRVSMELGGNAPFIVFNDADIDAAVSGVMMAKFRFAGQTCVAANRIFVHADVHDAFTQKLAERMDALVVGDPLDPKTDIGPVIHRRAKDRIVDLVQACVAQGARSMRGVGSSAPKKEGLVVPPTLLLDASPTMPCFQQEIFGPVACVYDFSDDEAVIEAANSTPYGLAAYFYTKDLDRAHRVSAALKFGMVGVNTGMVSSEVAPFGGVKQSGSGREGSKWGLSDYTNIKYTAMQYGNPL